MQKSIVANWKMHPRTIEEAVSLARQIAALPREHDLILCPPAVFLEAVHEAVPAFTLGTQNVSTEEEGALTGEVSAVMAKSTGVAYAIVGHSERRAMGETDVMVKEKLAQVAAAGLTAILCVGESREVHDEGGEAVVRFVCAQLDAANAGAFTAGNLVVAYEPVWAISGGSVSHEAEDPQAAAAVIRHIKSHLAIPGLRVLYGGSVNSANIKAILSIDDVDGVLVGSASLKVGEMQNILVA